ncbi:23S rRNA 5-methyluridine methyltransferase [Azotobacter vinelandii CA]|uniref:23S rRNA (uracil(1939)-C(5))-methyltransferase RlmD n=2 Tax=Azotobacter vinelandii TaxID=354 RepID=C1DRX8_AZOVD|nr:23S rRNA (uracil(1939)-C(5))-methyltransferase RlmD [Azotobacter vinelandii]ACO79853.1 23S rRNA (uracil-5-)-methyltransferase RumA [Azotobacter vinelandii DJ]AGK12929.1 23S rRNA 5-methyluridine methyltransferase [Azotobacter vinelandii CA]AGK18771.1 23S rRNA 5-methyluridine methyltransferase [Azotobacter vinelandii CA6]SFX43791.1 23S rRNA m(5)U-1939 methyltransferase [Azotobacter vinelandii]GLK62338.1 23S rRNA (uracil(1939)-C(5))-methyltransferase RlmD [Azotobacter vinelandii]
MTRRTGGLRFQPSGGARSAPLQVGRKQVLSIERLAHDGRGIAFVDGRTWFVSGALAGERVEARVLGARNRIVDAHAERILAAGPLRRAAPCAHAGRCGGCTLQALPHAEQLALKQRTLAEQLARFAGLAPEEWAPPLVGPEFGYRRRARIAVRWDATSGRLEVGFRAAASQAIVAIDDCPVLVRPLQPILRALPALLHGLARPRALGHVELFHGNTSAILVRHTAPLADADLQRLRVFCREHAAQLWLQGRDEPRADAPEAPLGYRLEPWGLELHYRPGDFVQVNAVVNEAMVVQALEWLAPRPEERVLDLFSGLGNFALPLAQRSREVVAVEGVAPMVERGRENATRNGLNNLHFWQADLSKPLAGASWAAAGFAAVLCDPPRDGALEAVRQVGSLGAGRVLYVSCNPATLARDATELAGQGYRLRRAGILDMFPQTAHVEAMALFEREPAAG